MPRGIRIKACTCAALDPSLHAKAALFAVAENPSNHPGDVSHPAAIHLIGKTWTPGRVLNVRFLDGTPGQIAKVQKWASYWSEFCNIQFAFPSDGDGDIRVTFTPGGSWSLIGTDCLAVAAPQATLQLGWVTDTSDDESDRAVIVHEFGHALGLGHEQQHPDEDIAWDKPKALAWYMRTQGWSAQTVQENVFDVYDRSQVAGTTYDRTSIMQYPVPAELTTDGRGVGWNTDLSALDKSHIAGLYPMSAAPTPPTPPPPPPPTPIASGLPEIDLDGDAAESSIPAAGQPASFGLKVDEAGAVMLAVIVERSRMLAPRVVATVGATKLELGIPQGRGTFLFQPGNYQIDVYHPLANAVGRVWVEAIGQ